MYFVTVKRVKNGREIEKKVPPVEYKAADYSLVSKQQKLCFCWHPKAKTSGHAPSYGSQG